MRNLIPSGVLVAVVSLWQPALAMGADLARPIPEAALLQAHVSLQAEQQLTTGRTYQGLGFKSVEEAKLSTLGTPWRVYMVRLDKLREYVPNRDPRDLLEDTNSVRYPVYVGNEVRSGIVVREVGKEWQIESIGRPALTKALVVAEKREGKAGVTSEPRFVVNIPALNMYFVGRLVDTRVELTSATDDPRFKIKAGQTLPAAEVFGMLVPYARQLKTGPRLAD